MAHADVASELRSPAAEELSADRGTWDGWATILFEIAWLEHAALASIGRVGRVKHNYTSFVTSPRFAAYLQVIEPQLFAG